MSDDYERLVVLLEGRVDAFEKAMVSAEKRGTATYQKLQRGAATATTAMQQRINQMAQAQGRALDQVAGKTEQAAERSRRSYEAWWREAERGRDKLNQLRASVDASFANQLRYEQAVEQLNDALRRNIITEGEHRQILDQVSAAYLRTGQAAGAHTGAMGKLGAMSDATRAKLQNAGYQVQDVAVMMLSGTDAARALSMQLPQLLSGFGLLGVVLGTLTAVGLPLLANWLGQSEGAAKGFDAALGEVRNSLSAMNEQAATYTADGLMALKERFGEVNLELLRLVELQTEAAQRDALKATRESIAALWDELNGSGFNIWQQDVEKVMGTLQDKFQLTRVEAQNLYTALLEAKRAGTFEEQLVAVARLKDHILAVTGSTENMTDAQYEFYRKVLDSEVALRELVATQPRQGWLSVAIGAAETLAGRLWNAVSAQAALNREAAAAGPGMDTGSADWAKTDLGFTKPGADLIYTPPATGGGRGGGRGGGATGGGSGRLDSLLAELQTEREVIAEWYDESLALLNGATEAELALVGGKHEALERLEAEHQERLRGIKEEAQTGFLAQADTFFGGMAALTKAGGDRMLGAHRAVSVAQGVINSYTAFTEVLKDPSFVGRPWARFGAATAALSSGLSAVASIRSGGGGKPGVSTASGGGSSGGASAETGAAAAPLRFSLEPIDPAALFTGATVRRLFEGIMEEAGNRGVIMVGRS